MNKSYAHYSVMFDIGLAQDIIFFAATLNFFSEKLSLIITEVSFKIDFSLFLFNMKE